jgi:hypothetical protein
MIRFAGTEARGARWALPEFCEANGGLTGEVSA